ncbi:hypothetical protein HOC99_03450 [Candidatus Woesearchaeota archaeon]|jgi:hypothetical protein|nr:hypothetical protein [Candidatus Woesearchaeota archaeon]MBT4387672.1 hypothetical protein [Candidatus Woesearchaeota archaeon]MBT4595965.1 hypothetical protein [Candidatus Woesearchaeota archaeon]MBT5741095.1 hypothetical protein [Candidatus Woesearchaeota archaeon]MBT7296201.1 hypothetical protein [Candidatus Woesearchaeota archaeon]
MAGKLVEAIARLFKNKFICKNCKTSIRTTNLKVIKKEVTCRSCGGHKFRPVRLKK